MICCLTRSLGYDREPAVSLDHRDEDRAGSFANDRIEFPIDNTDALVADFGARLNRDGSFNLTASVILEASVLVGFDFMPEVPMKDSSLTFIVIDAGVDRLMTDPLQVMLGKRISDLFRTPLLGTELIDNEGPRLGRAPLCRTSRLARRSLS